MTVNEYDIVIVGAGIAGSSLAAGLGDSGLKVALIEAHPIAQGWPEQSDQLENFDLRVSALTVASQKFLEQLQVWPSIVERRCAPYQHMRVWDGDGTGAIGFDSESVSQPALGHIVENRVTVAALQTKLSGCTNIQRISPAKLSSLDSANGNLLQLEDGRQLRASLIVAADGANSPIRQWMEFSTREWDYGHHAIVATVETSEPHQDTAWQRFTAEGPLAFLPLLTSDGGQQFCSIVWSTLPEQAERLMKLDDADFCRELGVAFEHRLGAIRAVGTRAAFPLRQRHASDYVKPGIALVADAAHTIHPLAGQGINLGLMDVQVLSEELLRAAERGLDLGSLEVLRRYQRRRKGHNLATMGAMEGFKRLFAEPALPVRWMRNRGMSWVDRATPLKRILIKQAMGL